MSPNSEYTRDHDLTLFDAEYTILDCTYLLFILHFNDFGC